MHSRSAWAKSRQLHGHASVNLWSGSLLTNEDAGNLTNAERLPVFVMMTCLNGYFHDPSLDSPAESLLKAENGGAVAVWTSTGMTMPVEQSVLNKQLYQLLFTSGNAMTLGEATARAKAAVTDGDITPDLGLAGRSDNAAQMMSCGEAFCSDQHRA